VDGDDLAAAGVAPEEVAKLKAQYGGEGDGGRPGDVPVTPDNWPAVRVFLMQEGRWRRTPRGALDGLDMAQVESTARLLRVKRKRLTRMFWKLMTMERAALEEMRR